MGYSSQSGQVLFREQQDEGIFETDIATAGVAMRTLSGTLSPNRDLMTLDAEIGGGRDVTDAYLGPVSYSGDLEFYPRMNSITSALYGIMGSKAHSVAGVSTAAVHTHTFTPIDVGQIPWYSMEEAVSDGYEVYNYTDMKFNSFHLEAEAAGFLRGTMGLIARKQVAGATRTDAADPAGDGSDPSLWDETPVMVGTNITVTYNGLTLPAKSFSFDLNNNLTDDDFRLGSFYLGSITEKRRDVMAGVSIRPEDSDLWRQAVYGTAAATQAGGITTKQAVVITMETYEVIGTSIVPYTLTITAAKGAIRPYSTEPSGDDELEDDLEIQFLRPSVGTPIVTAVVKNGVEAVA